MKLFTLEEANALLPELRQLFTAIKSERAVLQRLAPEAKRAHEHASEGGGIVFGTRYARALFTVMDHMQTVHDFGVEIKDLERGLCDFPCFPRDSMIFAWS